MTSSVADRILPAERFTGIGHIFGGVILVLAWFQTEFWPLWACILFYALLYKPTIATTNVIAFHSLDDSRKFGTIRVWGTIGWIAAGWILSGWRSAFDFQVLGDLFYVAAAGSLLLGLLSFLLPHTPPRMEARNPLAFLEAIKLLKDKEPI